MSDTAAHERATPPGHTHWGWCVYRRGEPHVRVRVLASYGGGFILFFTGCRGLGFLAVDVEGASPCLCPPPLDGQGRCSRACLSDCRSGTVVRLLLHCIQVRGEVREPLDGLVLS